MPVLLYPKAGSLDQHIGKIYFFHCWTLWFRLWMNSIARECLASLEHSRKQFWIRDLYKIFIENKQNKFNFKWTTFYHSNSFNWQQYITSKPLKFWKAQKCTCIKAEPSARVKEKDGKNHPSFNIVNGIRVCWLLAAATHACVLYTTCCV